MIGGVALITRRSRLSSDTAIGLLFVGMLALGVVIVSRSSSFAGDLVAILFGQILGTSWGSIEVLALATIGVAAVAAVCARPFLLLAFDPEQADVAGFPSRRYHAIMLVLIALTVVVSFQVVGTLLVFGMLLAPAAAGALLAHRIGTMMVIGAVIGAISSYLGLLISYWFDLAAGATMVLVAVAIFFVVFLFASWRDCAGRRPGRRDRPSRTRRRPIDEPRQRAAPVGRPSSWRADLAVGYRGDVVVGGIDVRVAPGASLALVGTNGSGKSTLLKTLVGLQPRLGGELAVLGATAGSLARAGRLPGPVPRLGLRPAAAGHRRRAHGPLPEPGPPGPHHVEDHDLVAWAMETMGVADLAKTPLRSLSGGQRQRVYLAQVLARRADLILLDEPNAGLDAGGRERYLDAFAGELRRGAALVTATHDIGEAIEYDQVLLLARRVVALGPGREVLTPDRLMETFGIVIRDPHAEHAGRFTVAERSHGAPQVVDLNVWPDAGEPPAPVPPAPPG